MRGMSAETLARWQFGVTTVYHFLFVPITLALSFLVAILQTIWVRTGQERFLKLTKFYGKLFLINFAMGVVTGIVQEFQFGMNWSEYSRFVGDIFGAPLALEALLAFFLESTFLGLWIFGWDRLNKKVHLATIWLAAIGTNISAIFILAANAWMQNPVGFRFNPETNRAELTNFADVMLNPVFLATFPHQITASWLVAGALMAGIAVWHLHRISRQTGARPSASRASRVFSSATYWPSWFFRGTVMVWPCSKSRVHTVSVLSTTSSWSRQMKCRWSFLIIEPGSRCDSVRIWKPLQMPSTGRPSASPSGPPAAVATASITGAKRAIAPARR